MAITIVDVPIGINNLPPEILSIVLANVPKPDLKHIRLLNKCLSELCTPYLFDTVVISPHRRNLEVFRKICAHREYSRHVRTLYYDLTSFDQWCNNLDVYKNRLRHQAKNLKIHPALWNHPDVMAKGFITFRERALEENFNRENYIDRVAMCDGFPRLCKLKVVRFTWGWREPVSTDPLNPKFGATISAPRGALGRTWPKKFLKPDTSHGGELENRPLENVLYALAQTKREIAGLYYGDGTRLRVGYSFLTSMKESGLKDALQSFSTLKSLSLSFHEMYHIEDRERKLSGLLRSAIQLEHLELTFSGYRAFPRIVADHTWPHLKSFSVAGLWITEEDFIAFYLRHSGTLRSIKMMEIYLMKGKWESFFDNLRAGTNLKSAYVTSAIAEEDTRGVMVYIEGGRVNYPRSCETVTLTSRENKAIGQFLVSGGQNPFCRETVSR